jgi:hypothetical protein
MKKVFIVVILLLVAAGGVFWFYASRPAEVIQPAQVLPQDTLVMFEAVDLKESLDEFRSGPLGRAISGIDWPACMRAFNASPEEIRRVQQIEAQITTAIDSLWFDALFGDLAVLAVLAPASPEPSLPPETVWRQSALMVLQPRQSSEMIQWIGKMFAGGVTITPVDVDGVHLDKVETRDTPAFFIAVHHNLMLAALEPAAIVRCLKPGPENRSFLADSPEFGQLRNELLLTGTSRSFVWIDLHRIYDHWVAPLQRQGVSDVTANEVLKLWAGFNRAKPALAAAGAAEGNLTHHRWRLRYNAADLSPKAVRVLGRSPQPNATLTWIPTPLLYYAWHNNLGQVIESVADLSRLEAEEAEAFRQKFITATGVPFEDAMNAFGDEFALLIQDVKMGGLFPLPLLALMAEVERPEVIERLVDSAVARFGMALQTEDHGSIPIRYLALPYGETLSPAYAFHDGFWVAASSRQLLKTLLDKPETGSALVQDPLFKAVDKGLSVPNSKMAFLRMDHIAARSKELITRGLSLAMLSGKVKDPRQITCLTDDVLTPIFDALARYPAMGSRTVNEENAVQADTYVLMPSTP